MKTAQVQCLRIHKAQFVTRLDSTQAVSWLQVLRSAHAACLPCTEGTLQSLALKDRSGHVITSKYEHAEYDKITCFIPLVSYEHYESAESRDSDIGLFFLVLRKFLQHMRR